LQKDYTTTIHSEEPVRVGPTKTDATAVDADANQAANLCQARDSSGLCSLSTLRSYWESLDWKEHKGVSISTWTRASCASCWLHWPGDCPTEPLENNESASQSWGTDYQMMATLTRQGIQTDCIRSNTRVPSTSSLCCSSNSSSSSSEDRSNMEDSSYLVLILGVTISISVAIALTQFYYGKGKSSTSTELPKEANNKDEEGDPLMDHSHSL
jgi:hypothetical protein